MEETPAHLTAVARDARASRGAALTTREPLQRLDPNFTEDYSREVCGQSAQSLVFVLTALQIRQEEDRAHRRYPESAFRR